MSVCPECNSTMSKYCVGEWTEQICWNCGHYESDSPAFKDYPEIFADMVRENPKHFMKKYLGMRLSDEILHERKSDEDFTEPGIVNFIY